MTDVPIPPDQVQDPCESELPAASAAIPRARPMQWDRRPRSRLHLAGDALAARRPRYRHVNVETQRADPRSMLTLHRRLLALRRSHQALATGNYYTLRATGGVLAYRRATPTERLLVALNLTGAPRTVPGCGRVLLSTALDREGERVTGDLPLRADEGVVLAQDARG